MHLLNLLLANYLGFAEITLLVFVLIPFLILPIISLWRIFEKAGEPGWSAIIPIYNLVILMSIAGKPWFWGLLACIPYIGLIFSIWGTNLVVKQFGKTEWFTLGIILLPFIFLPILAFGEAKFTKQTYDWWKRQLFEYRNHLYDTQTFGHKNKVKRSRSNQGWLPNLSNWW